MNPAVRPLKPAVLALMLAPVLALVAPSAPAQQQQQQQLLRLTPVLHGGDTIRGVQPATAVVEKIDSVHVNDRGDLAFIATLRPPAGAVVVPGAGTGGPVQIALTGKPGALVPLLRSGDRAPGLSGPGATGITVAPVGFNALDKDGDVLLSCRLLPPGGGYTDRWATYAGRKGALVPVVMTGRKIPGAAIVANAPGAHAFLDDGSVVVSAYYPSGQIVYTANLKDNRFTPIALPRRPLPGDEAAGPFRGFNNTPVHNGRGDFLFVTPLGDPDDLPAAATTGKPTWLQRAPEAVMLGNATRFTRVLTTGDPIPGGAAGATVALIKPMSLAIGNGGQIAVVVHPLPEPNAPKNPEQAPGPEHLLVGKPGALAPIWVAGRPAPGLAATTPPTTFSTTAVTFDDAGARTFVHGHVFRQRGVNDPVSTELPMNAGGLWLYENGQLTLLAVTNLPLPLPVAGLPAGETVTLTSVPMRLTPAGDMIATGAIGQPSKSDGYTPDISLLLRYHHGSGWSLLAKRGDKVALPSAAAARGLPPTLDSIRWIGQPNPAGQFPMIARLAGRPAESLVLAQLPPAPVKK